MMKQNIFENTKKQTPKITFVFVLKGLESLFSIPFLDKENNNGAN